MPKNDPARAVTRFCLAMELHRRTDAGRVRTPKELVQTFFPHNEQMATDHLFRLMPNEVRGPVIAAWGIRGAKAALKDDDERVRGVVHDALIAGDIDDVMFEDGITARILTDWVGLADWWTFWRNGKLTGVAVQQALATARELSLIDDTWFLANVQGRGGRLKGTDVVCDTLTKDQIVAWMKKIHETGDGSPSGLVAALGWEQLLAKTAFEALLFALDEFAKKAGLVVTPPPKVEAPLPTIAVAALGAPTQIPSAMQEIQEEERTSVEIAAAPFASPDPGGLDGGISVDLPDSPVEERAPEPLAGDRVTTLGDGEDDPPSIPSVEERSLYAPKDESAKLAEARVAMMAMLGASPEPRPPRATTGSSPYEDSEPPAKPSSLEWPEPPVVAAPVARVSPMAPAHPPAAVSSPSKEAGKVPPAVPARKPPVPPRAR